MVLIYLYFSRDATYYVGTFRENKKHGYGKFCDNEGDVVNQGKWEDDEFDKEVKKKVKVKKMEKLFKKIEKIKFEKYRYVQL